MVIPVPSHPIAAWYMHLWISFSMLVTVLKERVISCYVHRYITPMAWMGSYFLNYFQIRLHMVQGAQVRVCVVGDKWSLQPAVAEVLIRARKIQTGYLLSLLWPDGGPCITQRCLQTHTTALQQNLHSEFNCAAHQKAAAAEVLIKQRFTLKSLCSHGANMPNMPFSSQGMFVR